MSKYTLARNLSTFKFTFFKKKEVRHNFSWK
jgi:hypothetical protein